MGRSRRDFLNTVGAGAAGLAIGSAGRIEAAQPRKGPAPPATDDGPIVQIGEDIAVVDTTYGKVRGYILRGIHHYLGVPYGADTSGPNRFMPPQKPKPWTTVYPALWWGNTAPQVMENRYANKHNAWRDHWNYDDVGEDCLRLNVFTPAVNDARKRPVLVWMHGGGFTNGNGIEQDGYNGENFARLGDAVFVSVNHRLGPFGFTNLAGVGGARYAASGNVGMLDLVAALEWVRDNIASFGGDPGNVTIMGQSGGGYKVITVTAMPAAKGLFHKAVVLSGATTRLGERTHAEKLGAYVLTEAGLGPADVDKLQAMPWQQYLAIANRAQQKLAAESGAGRELIRRGFTPIVDGAFIPQHPYHPEPAPTAAAIPMLICSTFNEQSPSWADATLENVTLDAVVEKVRERAGFQGGYGEHARAVVEAYAKAFPGRKPVEIWSLVSSTRQAAVALADAKSRQTPPVFVAWFGWQPPMFDGRLRAFHCVDICFWFNNTDLMWTHTGGGARPRKLSQTMAGQLLQFMKTGEPNSAGLPKWPKYTPANGEVMILDDVCEVKNDPDREARKALPTT
jgi:para-nitrobenzyl esterase